MLVLSRKENEKLRIGDTITLTIVRIGNGKVRIGIDAPPEVIVLRDELAKRVAEELVQQPVARAS
jgi:carbon storage regulator